MRELVPGDVRRQLALPPDPAGFSEAELDGLPDAVRRHLRGAIAPGTALATSGRLRMRGQLKLGRWLPFRAEQVLAPTMSSTGRPAWAARVAGVVGGFDRYVDGHGELQWKLLGLMPVVQAQGPDVARSAVGRAAGEAMWIPIALLPRFGVQWAAADDRQVTAASAWMASRWTCTTPWRPTDGSARWSLTGGAIQTAPVPGAGIGSVAR
jgi:hypothetical protein